MARNRSRDAEHTARRRIDVAKMFRDARTTEARGDVDALMPADAVPVLAVPRAEIPWHELDELSTRLLLRVDDVTSSVNLIAEVDASSEQSVRALASLVERGLVRLVLRAEPGPANPTAGR